MVGLRLSLCILLGALDRASSPQAPDPGFVNSIENIDGGERPTEVKPHTTEESLSCLLQGSFFSCTGTGRDASVGRVDQADGSLRSHRARWFP